MFTTRPEIRGTFGVVASTHWLASSTAMAMLERGGNAFDAAAAAGFVLQVVEPHLNGPLGEVPMLAWDARKQRIDAICGQGVAPAAATIDAFRALDLDEVPGTGLLAACVPGAFDAWMRLLRDYGTMSVADVLAPAIHYAGSGYPLVWRIPAAIATLVEHFTTHWPTSAAVYLPNGSVPETGSLFRNPAIAEMYRRIAEEAAGVAGRETQIEKARKAWSQGFVAEAIDRFCRTQEVMDTSGRRHRGLLTGDDMARWEAPLERPLTLDYHGYTVAKCGAWCQGPVLLQQLALLKGFDLAAMDPVGPDFVHTIVECSKLAFADREAWYGDPAFADVPLETLLSAEYADSRRRLVGEEAWFELRPGSPDGRSPRLPVIPEVEDVEAAMFGVGEPTVPREDQPIAGDTCHVDVADRFGNLVSATPSGGWLHSSPAIPGLGLCLGTRAQMFWLEEGLPNSLEPGKRPRTTLTPSLALRDGEGVLAWGTPGGDGQDQWSLQFLLSHHRFGLNLQEAIDAPAFTSTHFPSSFYPRVAEPGHLLVEERLGDPAIAELRSRGHDVEVGEPWSIGRLSAVSRAPDGVLRAAANPRGMQGYAAGR
jgi:gamma-glutamyltranspeptidase/glutathione hydrolase